MKNFAAYMHLALAVAEDGGCVVETTRKQARQIACLLVSQKPKHEHPEGEHTEGVDCSGPKK
jgi:hypothetical protein